MPSGYGKYHFTGAAAKSLGKSASSGISSRRREREREEKEREREQEEEYARIAEDMQTALGDAYLGYQTNQDIEAAKTSWNDYMSRKYGTRFQMDTFEVDNEKGYINWGVLDTNDDPATMMPARDRTFQTMAADLSRIMKQRGMTQLDNDPQAPRQAFGTFGVQQRTDTEKKRAALDKDKIDYLSGPEGQATIKGQREQAKRQALKTPSKPMRKSDVYNYNQQLEEAGVYMPALEDDQKAALLEYLHDGVPVEEAISRTRAQTEDQYFDELQKTLGGRIVTKFGKGEKIARIDYDVDDPEAAADRLGISQSEYQKRVTALKSHLYKKYDPNEQVKKAISLWEAKAQRPATAEEKKRIKASVMRK